MAPSLTKSRVEAGMALLERFGLESMANRERERFRKACASSWILRWRQSPIPN